MATALEVTALAGTESKSHPRGSFQPSPPGPSSLAGPSALQTLWPTHLSLGLHAWHAWHHPLALISTLTSSSPGQSPVHAPPPGFLSLPLWPPPTPFPTPLPVLSVFPCSVVSDSLRPTRLLCPWGFSRQEYWSGLSCPPPGIFPSQGQNPGLPYGRWIPYHLSQQGS